MVYCWYPPVPRWPGEGGADYVKQFAEQLALKGCEVHVLTSHPSLAGGKSQVSSVPGVFIHPIVTEWGLRGFLTGEFSRVRRWFAKISPDVINLVYPGAKIRNRYVLPCLVKLLCPGVPIVTTLFHLFHPHALRNPFYLFFVFMLYLSSSRLCFQEKRHLSIFRKLFPFLARRCVFIPCGCNIEITQEYSLEASRQKREELGLSPGFRYVSFYGHWYPSKNVHILVQAVHHLVRKGHKVKLLIVGNL